MLNSRCVLCNTEETDVNKMDKWNDSEIGWVCDKHDWTMVEKIMDLYELKIRQEILQEILDDFSRKLSDIING